MAALFGSTTGFWTTNFAIVELVRYSRLYGPVSRFGHDLSSTALVFSSHVCDVGDSLLPEGAGGLLSARFRYAVTSDA